MAIFKKFTRQRRSQSNGVFKRFTIIVLLIVCAVAILFGFWFLSQLGPQNVEYRANRDVQEISDAVKALKTQSLELEAQFEEVLAMRPVEPGDLEVLKRALDLQIQYLNEIPGADSESVKRRDELRKRYQDFAASALQERSAALEIEAAALAKVKDYEAGRAKYLEAYASQKKINEEFPLSSSYNISRATRLERQARYLQAEPLYQRSLEIEKAADELIAAHEWSQAEARLLEAIAVQDQLNREYRGTNQASFSRLEQLRVKLLGIRSGQDYVEVEHVSGLADASRVAGENLEAAGLYQEAARLQRQLNEQHRGSPYASAERVAEFQRKGQTAESYELGMEVERNHDLLKRLLSERRTYEAAEVIADLRRDLKQMSEAYPRSSLNDEELEVKIRYLNLVQNDLGFIQDHVYDALLPIPEEVEWRMLRTEVPQALYSLIMGANPSRNQGGVNPVDSVSWVEAKTFCERLTWIMGKPVRLPVENEFRQALGRLRYLVLEDHVWSASSSEGAARPVGQKAAFSSGYHDLLGNVSEWLESEDRFETEDARHIGGHAKDRLEAIFAVPVRDAHRSERNRMTGFRIVVASE